MAGSIPGSDLAERRPGLGSRAPLAAVRWKVLRRAAGARLAPFGAAVMLLAVLGALAAPLIAPPDLLAQNLGHTLARPNGAHLQGTDNVGRDVLSRVIWGTRVSLLAGLVSVALAVVAGSLLGILAGYSGGRVDGLVMRLMDAVLSFPPLVLALALGAVLGAGLGGVLLALGVVYTPTSARRLRAPVRAAHARSGSRGHRARLRRRGAGTRRVGLSGRLAARGAERHELDHRAGFAERRLRHPRRGVAFVPGARHPAAAGVLGQHDQRRARLPAAGAVDRVRAGRGPVRHGGGIELRGRRRARRPRSENAGIAERPATTAGGRRFPTRPAAPRPRTAPAPPRGRRGSARPAASSRRRWAHAATPGAPGGPGPR